MADEEKQIDVEELVDSLEPKQFRLVEHIARGKERAKAYKLAGYKSVDPSTISSVVSEILIKPNVAAYLKFREAELNDKTREKTGIDRDWVIEGYREIHERCMQKSPVMIKVGKDWIQDTEMVEHADGTTTEEGVWKFDSRGAISALDGIARVMGFNAPLKVDAHHTFEDMLSQLKPSNN